MLRDISARVVARHGSDAVCARDDDHEALWRLWEQRRSNLRELCRKWLRGSGVDVEEILSVGALKAAEYLRARPRSVRNMYGWITRILYNLCLDRLRERARVVSLEDGVEASRVALVGPRVAETPEHRVHREQLGRSISRAVETLPHKLRAAFILRFVDELSYSEISTRLEISPQNARKRIQKARLRLRADLQSEDPRRASARTRRVNQLSEETYIDSWPSSHAAH
ncbi:MAG: RNA polymerase sigma factor [Myxococcales bacterium]|nr:RNA polymerase sigma factor [Myxococcales bacterium]